MNIYLSSFALNLTKSGYCSCSIAACLIRLLYTLELLRKQKNKLGVQQASRLILSYIAQRWQRNIVSAMCRIGSLPALPLQISGNCHNPHHHQVVNRTWYTYIRMNRRTSLPNDQTPCAHGPIKTYSLSFQPWTNHHALLFGKTGLFQIISFSSTLIKKDNISLLVYLFSFSRQIFKSY